MISAIRRVITGPGAGPAASAVAFIMAALLVASWGSWKIERARLEGRIAELVQQSERSQSLWRAQLSACHAAAGARTLTETAYARPAADPKDPAQRLLAQGPEGIDVCARMESADQAVLSTLK
ncbi:hypothetical protein [Phenylobacterium sp.]|uniref:hypothetical protein n=1 Tax=Phenylobacterium sp. TaxID=1871053 RepID=UPI003918F806